MKDRKGNELAVGDRVYVLPDKPTRTGGTGWVRSVKEHKARVDDGAQTQATLLSDFGWSWSAWVKPNEVEKI